MSVVGFQEFWLAGSRFYFQRDPVGGVVQPTIDFGVVQPATPNMEFEPIELKDSDGGFNQTVAEAVQDIEETYEVVCSNLNDDNLAILYLASAPQAYTQATTRRTDPVYAHPGRLVKLIDSSGDGLFEIGTFLGVYDDDEDVQPLVVTDIDASAKTITTSTDASGLTNGKGIIVLDTGLATPANAKSYTIVSTSGSGPTDITVAESPAADETSITGAAIGDSKPPADFSVYNAKRALIRMTPGGSFATAKTLQFVWLPNAITGNRLIYPQTVKGAVEGRAWLHWSRGNFSEEHVREGRVSVTPGGASFGNAEYSNMTLRLKFLSDLTLANPAGRLLHYVGTLPSSS